MKTWEIIAIYFSVGSLYAYLILLASWMRYRRFLKYLGYSYVGRIKSDHYPAIASTDDTILVRHGWDFTVWKKDGVK